MLAQPYGEFYEVIQKKSFAEHPYQRPTIGNIAELDLGNLETRGAGTFKGNSEHALPGTCVNSIADFQGAVCNLL